MNRHARVLLVDHLDAAGAAPADARARALALGRAGFDVETLLVEDGEHDDLQYGPRAAGPGLERLPAEVLSPRALEARVHASRAECVVWASAAPGGGPPARALPRATPAHWWPTGHAPAGAPRGPLEALAGFAPPGGGAAAVPERAARARLSLWDGPYVLVAAPLAGTGAGEVLAAFARVAREHDADLVVLDRPRPEAEALARAHALGARAHFVGPAPREAEAAWLTGAACVLVPGDAPVSGGLLVRSLALGVTPVPAGAAAAPIAAWLAAACSPCAQAFGPDALAATIASALEGGAAARAAGERARAAAVALGARDLPARLAAALGGPPRRAAA